MPRAQTICCDMPRRNSSPSAIAPPTPLCMPHKTAQTATRAAARCVCVRDLLSFRLSIGDHSPISCQTDSRKNASAPIYSVLSSSVLVCWLSGWVISYHISSFFKFCKFRATLILPLFLQQKKILAMTLLLHQGKNPFISHYLACCYLPKLRQGESTRRISFPSVFTHTMSGSTFTVTVLLCPRTGI